MKPWISLFSFLLGASVFFLTSCSKSDSSPPLVTDTEGNTYKTVRIGEQTWMAENLRAEKFSDGITIPVITEPSAWSVLATPGLCWYNNDGDSIKDMYGTLYNFYAVASAKLCPEGWHVPTVSDWQELMAFLGDTLVAGGSLKEAGTQHWETPNSGTANTAFNALPAGIRYSEGTFSSLSSFTAFWSSTEYDKGKGWYLSLYHSDTTVPLKQASKKDGFSVRCIKD